MYLFKQWREARVLLSAAAIGVALLLSMLIKVAVSAGHMHAVGGDLRGFCMTFFALEILAVGSWAWALGSLGAGKNLGEASGSYLFTRPRKRAWFVWHDWSFAAVVLAATIVLLGFMVSLFCAHLMRIAGLSPQRVPLQGGGAISLTAIMTLDSAGVLALAGLLYGLSYLCTILAKRSSGILIGVGVLVAYSLLSEVLGRMYHVGLPSFTPPLLSMHGGQLGIALAFGIAVRMLLALLFVVAARLVLDRAEI